MPMPPRPGGVEMAAIVSVAGEGSVIAFEQCSGYARNAFGRSLISLCKKLLVAAATYNLASTPKDIQTAGNLPGGGAYCLE